jgi:methylated-DNA-[protein]-cysteine S-methyltransferase
MTNMQPESLFYDRQDTPIGVALLITDGAGRLRAFDWHDHEDRLQHLIRRYYGPKAQVTAGGAPAQIRRSIDAYFEGDLDRLDTIECQTGGTAFQRSVWTALRSIPVGTTLSYGALAAQLGNPKAVRAVGLANGANPVGLVVPCHRVIGSDGSLTGYGGGIDRKRWLLTHERAAFKH